MLWHWPIALYYINHYFVANSHSWEMKKKTITKKTEKSKTKILFSITTVCIFVWFSLVSYIQWFVRLDIRRSTMMSFVGSVAYECFIRRQTDRQRTRCILTDNDVTGDSYDLVGRIPRRRVDSIVCWSSKVDTDCRCRRTWALSTTHYRTQRNSSRVFVRSMTPVNYWNFVWNYRSG